MAPRKTPIGGRDKPGFDVTVSSVIGRVTLGDGDRNPTAVAFDIIGGFFAEQDRMGDYSGGEFRFIGGSDGETIVVNVAKEFATPEDMRL